ETRAHWGRDQPVGKPRHVHPAPAVERQDPRSAPDPLYCVSFFFSSRRRHTRSVSAFLLNRSSDLGFGPLLEDKLCLIFKLAPSVCRMTFPILASLLVRLVVLLPFQLLRLSLATPSRWTPLALSVFLHCVVALLLTLL